MRKDVAGRIKPAPHQDDPGDARHNSKEDAGDRNNPPLSRLDTRAAGKTEHARYRHGQRCHKDASLALTEIAEEHDADSDQRAYRNGKYEQVEEEFFQ